MKGFGVFDATNNAHAKGLHPYPPSAVEVRGQIGHRMTLTAEKILHHLDIENLFAKHYHQRSHTPEVYGGFTGYGMLLDAIVKAVVRGIGGDEMLQLKERCISRLLESQDQNGAISIFQGLNGFWDSHDQAYMIQALTLDHRFFGNDYSLTAAIKLGEFLMRRHAGAQIGIESAFLMLAQESGEQRFLDYCHDTFQIEAGMEVYNQMLPCNGVAHVYTWLARVLAQLQYARLTGRQTPALFAGADQAYQRVFAPYSSISGSCSGGINWGELWDDSQIGVGNWGETCVSAYLLRCTSEMLRRDDAPIYGDLYERVLYNAFFAAQSADGLRQRYFTPFNDPSGWYPHETYCCPNNFRRMVFELPDGVFLQCPNGDTAINLYTDSTLTLPGRKIIQHTDYPQSGRVDLDIQCDAPFTLLYRQPGWSRQDGQAQWNELHIPAGKSQFVLDFPMKLRWIAGEYAQHKRVALLRGPIVYGLDSTQKILSHNDIDVLTIDGNRPVRESGQILSVPGVVTNNSQCQVEMPFVPFADERRCRTYFPYTGLTPIADELYHSRN